MTKVFENISFNEMPQALSHLLDKMDKIEQLLTQTQKSSQPEEPQWMDLKQLQAWLPDHPAAPTVYGWVRNNLIPYHKKGNKRSDCAQYDISADMTFSPHSSYNQRTS